jgi:hypothetical protein
LASSEAGFFWLQFKLGGQYYWTGSWAVGTPRGYLQLPDASYLYTYGRLLNQLRSELGRAESVLREIGGRWRSLDAGSAVTCNNIPENFDVREENFSISDLNREMIYQPALAALQLAQVSINAAVHDFRQICQPGAERQIEPGVILAALEYVTNAEQNLYIARQVVTPLQRRDPLLGNSE